MCVFLELSLQKCIHLQLWYLETDSEDKQTQQGTAMHYLQIAQTHKYTNVHMHKYTVAILDASSLS